MKNKRVLFVANHKGFSKFNAPYMAWFKSQGCIVDNASPGIEVGNVDNQYDIEIQRTPFSFRNVGAYKKLKKIIKKNHYDIIHCHTPMGGVIARLASISTRKKNATKVIYTSHGYNFYKGGPLKDWLFFFPVEKLLSYFTDTVVTINEEDYQLALRKKMALSKIFKIDGVGVDLNRFRPIDIEQKIIIRNSLGLSKEDFIILYTAQFIVRKNHLLLIKSLPNILCEIPNLKVLFAGNGPTFNLCKEEVQKMNLDNIVCFLGGRKDINELCGISDLHVATSLQEGQGINNIEAMACGCPIVVSDIRGHRDVCQDGINGFLFNIDKPSDMEKSIVKLYKDKQLYNTISEYNKKYVTRFSLDKEVQEMAKIYEDTLLLS